MSRDKNALLEIRGLRIEGRVEDKWTEIVHGVTSRCTAAR